MHFLQRPRYLKMKIHSKIWPLSANKTVMINFLYFSTSFIQTCILYFNWKVVKILLIYVFKVELKWLLFRRKSSLWWKGWPLYTFEILCNFFYEYLILFLSIKWILLCLTQFYFTSKRRMGGEVRQGFCFSFMKTVVSSCIKYFNHFEFQITLETAVLLREIQ